MDKILLFLLIFAPEILRNFCRNKHVLRPIIVFLVIHRMACAIHARLTHLHLRRRTRHNAAICLDSFDLCFRHFIHVLTQVLYILHLGFTRDGSSCRVDGTLRLAEHLVGDEFEFVRALEEDVEGGFELEDGFEDGAAAEDVEA